MFPPPPKGIIVEAILSEPVEVILLPVPKIPEANYVPEPVVDIETLPEPEVVAETMEEVTVEVIAELTPEVYVPEIPDVILEPVLVEPEVLVTTVTESVLADAAVVYTGELSVEPETVVTSITTIDFVEPVVEVSLPKTLELPSDVYPVDVNPTSRRKRSLMTQDTPPVPPQMLAMVEERRKFQEERDRLRPFDLVLKPLCPLPGFKSLLMNLNNK